MRRRTVTETTEHFDAAMAAARARKGMEYCWEIECYCATDRCPVRYINFNVKEHDGPIPAGRPPRCPLCRAPLKTHHVLGRIEAARREQELRQSLVLVKV